MQIRQDVSLAPFTTFGIGGPAKWFTEAASEEDVVEAIAFAREHHAPLFVLGGGSNLLVSDSGFPGLVLRMAIKGVEFSSESDSTIFSVAGGEDWDSFVSFAIERNCGGIECLAGIPGTVGGTPVQNVGAYGQEVSETILNVRAFDLESSQFVTLQNEACGFSYRRSLFNTVAKGRYIVSRVEYKLLNEAKPVISYADLKYYFQEKQAPNLAEVSKAVRQIRWQKGMLLVESDPDCRSAGSFFKNPIVLLEHFQQIESSAPDAVVPRFKAAEGYVKIPAAWLLDQAGFHKGYVLGQAGISSRHTLALINRGNATAADIAVLRDKIIADVEKMFAIRLEQEPVSVG